MKLAANLHHLYQELPPLERIDAAARDGFDGVEWPFPHAQSPVALAARLQAAGLPLVLLNTPLGPDGEPGLAAVPGREAIFRDGVERSLELAGRTGCTRLHLMAGCPPRDSQAPHDELAPATRDLLLRRLQWAVPLARQAEVRLLLEPLNHHDVPGYAYHRPAQAVACIEALGEPWLRLQFDIYHAEREGLDVAQALQVHRTCIGHVQIAQAPGRTAPDLGRPATQQALQALVDIGYDGWLGLEYNPGGHTADSLDWREPLRTLLRHGHPQREEAGT